MKVNLAISSESNNLKEKIDPRFGRAAGFVIFNLETGKFKYLDNGSSQVMAQGAGIKTASKIVSEDVKAVLTGFVGPKAFKVLESAGVEIIQDLNKMSVLEAVNLYKKGVLSPSRSPKGGSGKRGGGRKNRKLS